MANFRRLTGKRLAGRRLAGAVLAVGVLAGAVLAVGVLAGGAAFAQGTQNPSFNLLNRSASAIKELYVTPAGDARWGRNRLDGPVAAGASYAVRRRIDGNCIFDIRVVYANGRTEDRRGVNSCNTDDIAVGAATAAAAGRKAADDPSFRLVNRDPEAIIELYATPAGLGRWGENRLDTPLAPQGERIIHVDRQSSCSFDLKVVLANHKAREKRNTDLCRLTDLPVP